MDRNDRLSKWQAFKDGAKARWARLTDDDFEQVNGNSEKFLDILGDRYGYVRARALYEIEQFRRSLSSQLSAR